MRIQITIKRGRREPSWGAMKQAGESVRFLFQDQFTYGSSPFCVFRVFRGSLHLAQS